MYRFTQAENEQARHFFDRALQLDPTFARAYAGLSFTHWQNAFQRWGDRDSESALAYESAGHSLLVDDLQSAGASGPMVRALWLRRAGLVSARTGTGGGSQPELRTLGHYALSFVHSQSGDPQAAIGSSDHSRHLSPFDPLLFGMLGARAMAHVRLGQFEEAAEWALKAAARPERATPSSWRSPRTAWRWPAGSTRRSGFAAAIRKTLPDYRADDFIGTFRFEPDAEALFRQGARRIGLS